MLILMLVVVCGLPVAWFASEFQDRRWMRMVLGICALASSLGVAYIVGSLEQLNYNAWYGGASKDLIDVTVAELEAGRTDDVIKQPKILSNEFHPTYENKARYDALVQEYALRLDQESRPVH